MTLARVVHDRIQETGTEIEPVPEAGGLEAWARKAALALDIAKALALTPFVPESLIVKAAVDGRSRIDIEATTGNVLGVLLAGDELGLQPMAALRSVDIISGTPALRAIALRGIVQGAGHELVVEESTSTRCVVKGRRKGTREWQKSMWDLDRARGLGLAGKENWRKQPTAMLLARASAECARMIASDALLGMPYAAEELDDGLEGVVDADGTSPTAPAAAEAKPRTARRRGGAAAATPAAVDAVPAEDVPEPDLQPEPAAGTEGGGDDANGAGNAGPPPPTEPPAAAEPDRSQPFGPRNRPAEAPPAAAAPPAEAPPQPELANNDQLRKLHICLTENGIGDRETGLAWLTGQFGRPFASSKELTKAEASQAIDTLDRLLASTAAPVQEPPFDDVPPPDEPPPGE